MPTLVRQDGKVIYLPSKGTIALEKRIQVLEGQLKALRARLDESSGPLKPAA
jgi:hypothetical protein